jgi:hypothetical protein
MNRTIKLLAYTVFAILFPFWIFLGKLSEKTAGSSMIGIDTSSIKNITQGVIAVSRESRGNQNPNQQLDILLQQLVIQNIETSRSINELEKVVRSGNPGPGNIEVKITPPEIKLNIPIASDPGNTNLRRSMPVADSISMVLDDIKKDVNERTAAIDSSTYLIVFDINVTDRSINKDFDLRDVCCKNEKEYVSSVGTQLDRIRQIVGQLINFSIKGEEDKEKNLLSKIDTIKNSLGNFTARKESVCSRRKIIIGIRNVSNSAVNLIDANNPFFQVYNKNQIAADSNKTTDWRIAKNEIIYFKVNDICSITKPVDFISIGFVYPSLQNSFLFKKPEETSYLNIRTIR